MALQYSRQLTLVLGGARSGKSRHAETLLAGAAGPWTYIATAQALDDEMRARIESHRLRRGPEWTTIEAPVDLPLAIARNAKAPNAVLVDCLTLWLSNLMIAEHDTSSAVTALIAALHDATGNIVLVSNEVGMGIVPDNRLARDFRDAQGELNRLVANEADRVVFVAAGLPLTLK